jgi:hypothetical protein
MGAEALLQQSVNGDIRGVGQSHGSSESRGLEIRVGGASLKGCPDALAFAVPLPTPDIAPTLRW